MSWTACYTAVDFRTRLFFPQESSLCLPINC